MKFLTGITTPRVVRNF